TERQVPALLRHLRTAYSFTATTHRVRPLRAEAPTQAAFRTCPWSGWTAPARRLGMRRPRPRGQALACRLMENARPFIDTTPLAATCGFLKPVRIRRRSLRSMQLRTTPCPCGRLMERASHLVRDATANGEST